MQLCDRLKEERERFGLSQEDFSAWGGVKPRAYWNYEKGKVPPDTDFLARLRERGVDVWFVMTGEREGGAVVTGPARELIEFISQGVASGDLTENHIEAILNMLLAFSPPALRYASNHRGTGITVHAPSAEDLGMSFQENKKGGMK